MIEGLHFGSWLKQRRKALDLTQDDLADKVGCSWETIRKIEEGTRKPSRQMAELLAQHLRVPTEEQEALVRFARGGVANDTDVLAGHRGGTVGEPVSAGRQSGVSPNNLPAQRTPFVGRQSQVEAVATKLLLDSVRLLTLTGPPGIGKTRLSQQVAARLAEAGEFKDGIYFVPLASISDPGMVATSIARELGMKESAGQSTEQALKAHLLDKELLLVLDNFEQVTPAGTLVAGLLSYCPRLKVLVTSRAVLQIYGEHDFPVPPLVAKSQAVEATNGQNGLHAHEIPEAIELFVQRAHAARSSFVLSSDNEGAIAEICRKLDGLPLAIELAAARISVLSPQAILSRLSKRLELLTTGALDLPPRQRTLRGAIAWSYNLLDDDEKALYRRLGVFTDGCTLEALESVCTLGDMYIDMLDLASGLVQKSLLLLSEGVEGEPRLTMLETIREYALERLEESGEAQQVRDRHASYFLSLAEEGEAGLQGQRQRFWLDRLDQDGANFGAAVNWAAQQGDHETALQLVGHLNPFWWDRGHYSEGRRLVHTALSIPDPDPETPSRAKALYAAGRLAFIQNDAPAAQAFLEESLAVRRTLGDKRGMIQSLRAVGELAFSLGDYGAATSLYEEGLAIAQDLEERPGIAMLMSALGRLAAYRGEYEAARSLHEASLAIRRELGDELFTADSVNALAYVAYREGNYEHATALFNEALLLWEKLGHREARASCLLCLGDIAFDTGSCERALSLWEQARQCYSQLGNKDQLANCLLSLGLAYYSGGNRDQAREHFQEGLSIKRSPESIREIAEYMELLAILVADTGNLEPAADLLGCSEALRERENAPVEHYYRNELWRKRLSELLERIQKNVSNRALTAIGQEGKNRTPEEVMLAAIVDGNQSGDDQSDWCENRYRN